VAVLGDLVLVPVGDGELEGVIAFEGDGVNERIVATVNEVAGALRPFAQLFVRRLRSQRMHGAVVEENRYFRARQREHYLFKELVRESEAMRAVHERLELLRDSDEPILFAGEAGTGKELLARLLHHGSARADQMIMRVNCAEFADESANIELFGSSGDDSTAGPRKGVFELARHGTVLLEEIDMLPPMVQAKLCRLLKESEVRRVGDSVGRPVTARLIATGHRDVSDCVVEGRLRRDLYLLLRDQTIVVPSLRDRRADILPLARKFLGGYAARYGRNVDGFTPEAESRMLAHGWPGNVRELQARVEASVLGTNGPRVGVVHLGLPDT
jgi:DNA-binding NtrC family response regulator